MNTYTIGTTAKIIAAAKGQNDGTRGPVYQQIRGWREREALKPTAGAGETAAYVFDDVEVARAFVLIALHAALNLSFEGVKNMSGWLRTETHRGINPDGTHDARTFERCFHDIQSGKTAQWEMIVSPNANPDPKYFPSTFYVGFEIQGRPLFERSGIRTIVPLNDLLAPLVESLKQAKLFT